MRASEFKFSATLHLVLVICFNLVLQLMLGSRQLLVRPHVARGVQVSTLPTVKQDGDSTGPVAALRSVAVKQDENSTGGESGEDVLGSVLRSMATAADSLLLPGEEVVMCGLQDSEADSAVGVPSDVDV